MNPLNPQQQEQQQQQRQSGQQPGAPSLMQFPGMAYPAGPWFDPGVFGLPAAVPTQSSVRSASPSHTHSGGTPSFSGSMGAAFGTNPHEAYGGQPGPAGVLTGRPLGPGAGGASSLAPPPAAGVPSHNPPFLLLPQQPAAGGGYAPPAPGAPFASYAGYGGALPLPGQALSFDGLALPAQRAGYSLPSLMTARPGAGGGAGPLPGSTQGWGVPHLQSRPAAEGGAPAPALSESSAGGASSHSGGTGGGSTLHAAPGPGARPPTSPTYGVAPRGGAGALSSAAAADPAAGGTAGLTKSRYRGVSYDRKKAKWRVQIKVAALGKSGVSVGYYDTEEAAARAYDRAAIGLLGRDSHSLQTNYGLGDYAGESIPRLAGKSREEVKTTLKSERIKAAPRRRFTSRQRTSRFMGVGSSNRKNQWQARILVHGKVTHLGYYETEAEAARVYDRVSIALHGDAAQTNFPAAEYPRDELRAFGGLEREDLQRALGVKPMDKSSRYRGVSKKKGRWEAKVMVNRRWAYRELFDSEEEAARAYDSALWRLKPKEARSYVNFKDEASARAGGGGHAGGGEGAGASDASDADPDLSSGEEDEASDAGSEFSGSELGLGFSLAATGARPRSRRVGSAPNLARWAMSQQAAGGAGAGAWPPGGWATGGGAAGPPLARSFSGTPSENAPVDEEGARALSDPLLDRFGSGVGGAVGGAPRRPPAAATLGKRDAPGARALPRTASEPHFPSVKLEEGWTPAPVLGEVAELLYDDDFFALAFEGGGGATPGTGPARGGGSGPAAAALTFDMDFETAGLLDFIKDMPDAGAGPSLGKSRSAVDLSSWDPASEMDFGDSGMGEMGRPRKMSKSVSMGNLAGWNDSPPDSDGSGGAKLGPLGHPIRRINTFATKLPTFEEVEERAAEGGYASDHLTPRKNGNQGEGEGDDLVAQLMEPSTSQMEHDYSMDLLT